MQVITIAILFIFNTQIIESLDHCFSETIPVFFSVQSYQLLIPVSIFAEGMFRIHRKNIYIYIYPQRISTESKTPCEILLKKSV